MTLPGLVRANNLNDVVDRERAWDNLGSSLATGDIAIPAPSLDLNFAANKSLVDDISGNNLITFSRASTGTFVGSNGLIQTAASGVPRFDHNPTTGESLGLLVEEARTNLLQYSQDITDVAWAKSNATVTKETLAGPAGTVPYDKITLGTFTNTVGRADRNPVSTSPSVFYTASIYAKAGTCRYIGLVSRNYDSNGWGTYFDLVTGVVTQNRLSTTFSILSVGNGWYRLSIGKDVGVGGSAPAFIVIPLTVAVPANGPSNNIQPLYNGNGESLYVWAPQFEAGSVPTSYIPTTGSTVARAADVASITGANFSSWYRANEGTFFVSGRQSNNDSNRPLLGLGAGTGSIFQSFGGTGGGRYAAWWNGSSNFITSNSTTWSDGVKIGASYTFNNRRLCLNAGAVALSATLLPNGGLVRIGANFNNTFKNVGTISRLTYWPSSLNDVSLQYITQPSITAINLYAFNYAINGKDVLALNAVRNASTRNFIFIKGLLSAAQPRLTAAAASTFSALTLATNALPKLSPTSSGNYFFASGITLSGVTTRINGTNALSIATSPFSGSTATAPLLFRELRPQANWRFTEPMPSGTIASPEFAIPFETNDFVLFMKAGPN
jgi:hypothetical protein